jgi:hypothetical protein
MTTDQAMSQQERDDLIAHHAAIRDALDEALQHHSWCGEVDSAREHWWEAQCWVCDSTDSGYQNNVEDWVHNHMLNDHPDVWRRYLQGDGDTIVRGDS